MVTISSLPMHSILCLKERLMGLVLHIKCLSLSADMIRPSQQLQIVDLTGLTRTHPPFLPTSQLYLWWR